MIVSKFVLPRTHCNKHLDKFVNSRIDSYISHIPFIDRTTRPPLISLTMRTNYADNQTYESCTEATGREYLFREVCGAAALPAGEGGAVSRGNRRGNWYPSADLLRLGSGATDNTPRCASYFGYSFRIQKSQRHLSRKIIRKFRNCENSATPPIAIISQCVILSPVMKNFGEPTISTLSGQTFCPATRPEVFHHRKQQRGAGFFTSTNPKGEL